MKKNIVKKISIEPKMNYDLNLLQDNLQSTDIKYKVITTTRNTFTLKTTDNIANIIKTSSNQISNGYFQL